MALDHILRHGRLGDLDAEPQQLAMDPRRTLQSVRKAHLADQLANLLANLRTAAFRSRLPAPVGPEAVPMPADHGSRLVHCYNLQNPWAQPVQQDKNQAVSPHQVRSQSNLPARSVDLMAEHRDFGVEPNL